MKTELHDGLLGPDDANEIERLRAALAALAAQAVPQRPALDLAELIRGMSVSVDVSTNDVDIGNRYFGTVVEVMECAHGITGVKPCATANQAKEKARV